MMCVVAVLTPSFRPAPFRAPPLGMGRLIYILGYVHDFFLLAVFAFIW
jgi:hypothetical protein